ATLRPSFRSADIYPNHLSAGSGSGPAGGKKEVAMIGTIIGNKTLTFSALALAAMTVVGTASYAGSNDVGTAIPVVCEVVATTAGGGTTLEAIYNAQGPENGTYRFSVKTVGGAGNTNINQGGGFSA